MKPKELIKQLADVPDMAEIVAVIIDQSKHHKGQIIYIKDDKTVVVSFY